ncbi:MAG: hypothetical protein ABIT96_10300 [Ferruginibacter sp.]
MNEVNARVNRDISYYRLIALWVACEGFAGGIMHALALPFTGMIISGMAVLCLCLLGWYFHSTRAILKATLIVIIFKLLLSPHSPPTAYIAVSFQGIMAALLFRSRHNFHAKSILLGILALTESAIQKILVLWLVFGSTFWNAIDGFIDKLLHPGSTRDNLIYWMAGGYIFIHIIGGFIIGHFAAAFARNSHQYTRYVNSNLPAIHPGIPAKPNKIRWLFVIAWLILLTLLLQGIMMPENRWLPKDDITQIVTRALLIIGAWYFILAPLGFFLLRKLTERKKKEWAVSLEKIQLMLPEIKQIFLFSLQASKEKNGLARLSLFIKIIMANVLFRHTTEK